MKDPADHGKQTFAAYGDSDEAGTGRAVFPLRSLVPLRIEGLLGAQKNLGYTSIVGSSCRLHDQSVAIGQAAGAVAAVSLKQNVAPIRIAFDPPLMSLVWDGLLGKHGVVLRSAVCRCQPKIQSSAIHS